jgi:hypothetical protein
MDLEGNRYSVTIHIKEEIKNLMKNGTGSIEIYLLYPVLQRFRSRVSR